MALAVAKGLRPQTPTEQNIMAPSTPKSGVSNQSPFASTVRSRGRGRAEDVHEELVDKTMQEKMAIIDAKREVLRAKGEKVISCEFEEGCFTMQFLTSESRPCISDYFGRNKAKTRAIKRPVIYCRKHYQRCSNKESVWRFIKIRLILEQIERIEEDHPNTTYDVSLKKSEMDRLSKYNNEKAAGKNPSGGIATKKVATIPVLKHIYVHFVGKGKTKTECEDLVNWCRTQIIDGHMEFLPTFEMVPNISIIEEDEETVETADDEDSDDVFISSTPTGPSRVPVTPKRSSPNKPATPGSRAPLPRGVKKP
jgi:hypothetical protein